MSRFDKQTSTGKDPARRAYVMRRRAALVDATRERITAAAVRLHTTIGPSGTSIAAIAAEAGVTRLTVYHHFTSQDELFVACMAHWAAIHPWPDVSRWQAVPGVEARARHGLRELYAWYVGTGEDLYPIHRDIALVPPGARQAMEETEGRLAAALLDDAEVAPETWRRLLAVSGHVVDVETWRSLVVKQGLPWEEAVEVAVALLVAVANGSAASGGDDRR